MYELEEVVERGCNLNIVKHKSIRETHARIIIYNCTLFTVNDFLISHRYKRE